MTRVSTYLRVGVAALSLALRAAPASAQSTTAPDDSVGPGAFRFRGVRITPVGYATLEAVYRTRALAADIGTPFNAIPFRGAPGAHLSELRLSARQSRLGAAVDGHAGPTALRGFVETDFLGAGSSSNSNESNSYALRLRQFWAEAAFANGLTLSAGQTWSLLTPGRSRLALRAESVPATIDAQYVVGFDWARQAGVRLTSRLGSSAWGAIAIEESQTTFLSRGTPDRPFLVGQAGGSALNPLATYSYDAAPDLIAKLAFEPGIGHYELRAVGRLFRDRVYAPFRLGEAQHADNYTTTGGGVGADARWAAHERRAELGIDALWGRGIGRYGTSQLPDATVRADGHIAPIRAAHGLASLDLHPTATLDLYAYAGVEYAARTADTAANGTGVGYGSPRVDVTSCDTEVAPAGPFSPGGASCLADTRALRQGTVGLWHRAFQGDYGTAQWGLQYSYTSRLTWATAPAGLAPRANAHVILASLRYVLPQGSR